MVDTLVGVRRTQLLDAAGALIEPATAAQATALQTTMTNVLNTLLRAQAFVRFFLASSAANNNSQVIVSGVQYVSQVRGVNTTAAVVWLKLFNKATGPTVGTDSPLVSVPLPPGAFNLDLNAAYFPVGLGMALVTGAALLDNTAVTAGAVVGLSIGYRNG
jgi:hypothetical protein